MVNSSLKIISLLPSTTEIICALGREENLIGRSHECDFPKSIQNLPACTEPKFKPDGTSYEIDQRVKALLQEGLSVYRVDAEKLAALNPDVIITQDHCEVCAASLSEVRDAVQKMVGPDVHIVSVSPTDLSGVFQSIHQIAEPLHAEKQAEQLVQSMKNKFDEIRISNSEATDKTICCIEWLNPLMVAGNWVPELVHIAGGQPMGGQAGKHSPWFEFDQLIEIDPDVVAIMPCGYSIEQTFLEADAITEQPGWNGLKAVCNNEVYLLDGNHYFNRPGPRLNDSTQILAEILHPDVFEPIHKSNGWIKLQKEPG